jgi:FSR family fosmidomycin resistance protein-like MFS transporter
VIGFSFTQGVNQTKKMTSVSVKDQNGLPSATLSSAKQTLVLAGIAHALHDGYNDMIYILLPIWQSEFGLNYGELALLRGLYTGATAALQVPAGRLATRFNGRNVLALGTALAALGFALAGFSAGVIGLCVALIIAGIGSSTQHPLASAAVARAYGSESRVPLGTYNFTGDLGKATIPALISVLLTFIPWRGTLWILAVLGFLVTVLIARRMPLIGRAPSEHSSQAKLKGGARGGFPLLLVIGVLDTGVRMGLLTFLPFLLKEKGAALPTVGVAFTLVFIGGAAGKFTCGWLGSRVGMLRTVLLTEGGTAACIIAVLLLPLMPLLVLLPLLGVMLNGTSSVLYGTVPELAPAHRSEHAFAVFYTGTIGSSALSPVFYGVLADGWGTDFATWATAATALAIFPLAFALSPHLSAAAKRY